MNTSRLLILILPLIAVGILAHPAFGVTDEIDRGVFKWLYSKDTEQIYKKPLSMKTLQGNPRAYYNIPVTLRVRFHRVETGLFVPEFTPFSIEEHLNFSAWDADAALWEENEIKSDFPLLFVKKDSGAAQDLIRLKKFDVVEVFGAVVSLFENQPWFEVERIWLAKKSELTNTLFSHIRLAEDMYAKGMFELTVGELDRILRYDLSGDLAGMLFKRKGESLLALKKYPEAIRAYSRSNRTRRSDADVYRGWGTALMHVGDYEMALVALEKSLVYKAKQANIYAKMGYCRGKLADIRVAELSVDKDYIKEFKPEHIRRRDKQVRTEYDPGRMVVTEKIRERITETEFLEIIAEFELAILDCRKALFIDASNTAALDWKEAMEKRLGEFKKKYTAPEKPKPRKKPPTKRPKKK
ncbi:MAG: tetratricopeptide repeat protein [Planctomycetota bacterium]|jgi:tetratricopeptide (TPR) repeat protein